MDTKANINQMRTKLKISILVTAAIVCVTSAAFAEKVCLRTTVDRRTLKVTNDSLIGRACPNGYSELVDTSIFRGPEGPQGPKGDKGDPGVSSPSNSTCYKKTDSHTYQSSGSNRISLSDFELRCAPGEYAYHRTESNQLSCSQDWSWRYDGDDDSSRSAECDWALYVPIVNRVENQVSSGVLLDSTGAFVVGHSHSMKAGDRGVTIVSGAISATRTITLTCCTLGE